MNVLFLTGLDKYRTVLPNILCSCKTGIIISKFSFTFHIETPHEVTVVSFLLSWVLKPLAFMKSVAMIGISKFYLRLIFVILYLFSISIS